MEVIKQPQGEYRHRFGNLTLDLTDKDRRNLQWCIEYALNTFPVTGDACRTSKGKVFVEPTEDRILIGAGPLLGDEVVDEKILKKLWLLLDDA